MTITLPPYLVEALNELATRRGVTPEELAIELCVWIDSIDKI